MSRLDELKQQELFQKGAIQFTKKHRDVAHLLAMEANYTILSGIIAQESLPPQELASWEKAFEAASKKKMLASPVKETPLAEPEPEKWNHPFPEIHTYADVQALDGKIYRDFWYDKDRRTGQPSAKSLEFRAVVQEIIDRENAQRSQQ